MTPFSRSSGTLTRLDDVRISQWVPTLPHNIPIMERWKRSLYIVETPIGDLAEWKLILEQPVAPFQKALYKEYSGKLALLFLILLGALGLAEVLSRRIVDSLRQLSVMTCELPARLAADDKKILWPRSRIEEASLLVNNFRDMANALSERFKEIRQINSTLEQRVNEQTAELRESEINFRTLADSGRALVWKAGTDKLCNYFNAVWLDFTGRTYDQEFGNGWAEGVHPDDFQYCLDIYITAFDKREAFSMVYRLRRHDGEYRWLLDDGCPRYNSDGEFIGYIGHCLDITELKQAESLLLDKIDELQRFQAVTVERELMMIELKKEVNDMLKKSGQAEKYRIVT
jgi:PAS domain S-box-containing protein